MKKIEGIIFDWAGTAVDFGCFAPVNVFIEIFKQAGIDVTMEEARIPMGMLKRDHIKTMMEMNRISDLWKEKYGRLHNEEDIDNLYAKFEPMLMKSLSNYTTPIEGVIETIENLRNKGLKIGSTTGYTDSMMDVVTKGAKEKGYAPDFYVTPDSTNSNGRPYPYMIYRNMEALKLVDTSTIIKVGDTNSDIKEGLAAGVWSVGVIVGSSNMGISEDEYNKLSQTEKDDLIEKTKAGFMEAGAHFTINTIKELPELIEKINELIKEGKRPYAINEKLA